MSYKALTSFIWQFIRPQRWAFFAIFIFSLAWALDQTVWPYILQVVIDILTRYEGERAAVWPALQIPVIWGAILWIGVEFSFRCQGFLLARVFPKMESDIRMTMFDHIQRHSPRYFNEHFAGSLANKVTDMTTHVTLILQQLLTLFIPVFVSCLLANLFLAEVNLFFAVALTVWIIAHFSICILFARGCDRLESIHSELRSTLLGKVVDSLTNNFVVNLYSRFSYEKYFIGQFQEKERQAHIGAKNRVEVMRVFLGLFTFLIGGVAINAFMISAWMQGTMTTGEVALVFNTTWNICALMWMAGWSIPSLFQSVGIAKQALSVMYDPQDVIDHQLAKPLQVSQGEIVFNNVSFHYGGKSLFKNKNVHIRSGEKVGLVGYSGAGKSTFVNLILRFYQLQEGKILIDGQDISTITFASLRQQIALIPQDPILFHRSLKENIRYGRLEAPDEEVYHAAQLAHCDEFIKRLPEGYDTLVGERGTKLSGGERQRIAIARAFLANSPILILDEATSALDSITEKYIQDSLDLLMKQRTTVVIAHRLSTLSGMDRILVFDSGKIVEEGTHEALLETDGHYGRMWQMQAGGFLVEDSD